ncbi:unnamed protein product [Camellia sinensis]
MPFAIPPLTLFSANPCYQTTNLPLYTTTPDGLSQPTIHALKDCQSLLGLNMDFLSTTIQSIDSTDTLQSSQADDTHILLSAIITSHQTCSDGLQATTPCSSIQNNFLSPFDNGNKLYSVSLALFKYGYVPKTRKGRCLAERESMFSKNGHFGLKMSNQHRKVYESVSGRKLLQTSGGGQVKVNIMVFVNKDGSGNFMTISDAVAAAPNNTDANTGYFMIYVVGGVYELEPVWTVAAAESDCKLCKLYFHQYEEYVSIAKNKQYLMIVGDGINKTIITGNHSVADGWTTYSSATVAVVGPRFVAINITIRNTAGAIKQQAVALRNDVDLSTFYKCSFEGYQDTLYTHSLRQFYRECDIYGTIDFIFGNVAVVFQNCNVYPRLPILGQFNTITAQGRTDINQNTGTSIQNCTITAAPDLAANNGTTQTYLGRPWKLYSRTVYMQSFLDSLINPAGWAMWSGTFALDTLYYAEYNNREPGSSTANRVTWPGYHVINATDAVNFTISNFVSGNSWLPTTGVPYTGGLILELEGAKNVVQPHNEEPQLPLLPPPGMAHLRGTISYHKRTDSSASQGKVSLNMSMRARGSGGMSSRELSQRLDQTNKRQDKNLMH